MPKKIISDRGTAFTSREFDAMINSNNIVHHNVAVATPWSNGIVERVNRFLKSILQKLMDEPHDWKHFLSKAAYIINNTFHQGTKSKLLVGYDLRGKSDFSVAEFVKEFANRFRYGKTANDKRSGR